VTVDGVILAAGASTRLGQPKQLLLLDGEPMLRVIAREALASRCERVAVVLGAHADEIRGALAGLSVEILDNPGWAEGMSSSVRVGVAWCAAPRLLLMVGDQPRLTRAHLDALIAVEGTVGSAYGGTVGVPAIFDRAMFPALAALRGDQGARRLLAGAASVAWADGELDIDTITDTRRPTRPRS
jgi:CTP:molybdopterin cytidylyltransferase MocA